MTVSIALKDTALTFKRLRMPGDLGSYLSEQGIVRNIVVKKNQTTCSTF